MITIQFREQDSDKFYENLLRESHPKTRLKNFALYLKCMGFPHTEIYKLCRISKPTLVSYLKDFKTGGFDSFQILNWKGQKTKLYEYKDRIESDFNANPPRSILEARERIEKLTGISRSPTQIQDFLKSKLNYRYLKVGSLPGNGKDDDEEKENERDDFKKNNLNRCWIKQEKERR
jgi:hypothetical protein